MEYAPAVTAYLPIAHTHDKSWQGKASVETVVVFGDSYSVDYNPEHPFFTGNTWAGLFHSTLDATIVNFQNFAQPGATAQGDLSGQLDEFRALKKRDTDDSFDGDATLYVFAFGINDCGSNSEDVLEPIVQHIITAMGDLTEDGVAKSFLLLDVPPIERSPGVVQGDLTDLLKPRYDTWNALLRARLLGFISSTPSVNVFLFSLHHTISQILDVPGAFGFTRDDVALYDGPIWEDHLHLTVEVHAVIADEIIHALFGAPSNTITRVN